MECLSRAPVSLASYLFRPNKHQPDSPNCSLPHQTSTLTHIPVSLPSISGHAASTLGATSAQRTCTSTPAVTMAVLEGLGSNLPSLPSRPVEAFKALLTGRTSSKHPNIEEITSSNTSPRSLPVLVPIPVHVRDASSSSIRVSAMVSAQMSAPSLEGTARITSSLLISFLVNYSVLVSDWWQFKQTARDQLIACLGGRWPLAATAVHAASDSRSAAVVAATAAAAAAVAAAAAANSASARTHHPVSQTTLIRRLKSSLRGNKRISSSSSRRRGVRTDESVAADKDDEAAAIESAMVAQAVGLSAGTRVQVASVVRDDLHPSMEWAQRREDLDAEARLRESMGEPGFSFSAAGLLFPYHLGATQYLIEHGYITDHTPLAGASAGSLVCAVIATGVRPRSLMRLAKLVAADCRANGTAFRIGVLLRGVLQQILPDDAHIKCSGRIRVAITQVFGSPRGMLVDHFDSREDLINALIASSFVPGYLEPRAATSFRNRMCVDGGLSHFIPPTASRHTVRICAFPASAYGLSGIDINPDMNSRCSKYSIKQFLSWALEPADDSTLDALFDSGYQDAVIWAASYTGPGCKPDKTRGREEGAQAKVHA